MTIYQPIVAQRLTLLVGAFMRRGMDIPHARTAALQVIAGAVARQGMTIAFDRVFALTGVALALTLPLVLVLRQSEHDDHPHSPGPAIPAE